MKRKLVYNTSDDTKLHSNQSVCKHPARWVDDKRCLICNEVVKGDFSLEPN